MKLAVNAVTRAPNAAPISTATARSTTLPRSRNFRKPLMALPRSTAVIAACPRGALLSGNRQQHAGVEDAGGVDRVLGPRQRLGERLGTLSGGPRHVGAAGRPGGGERGP